MLECRNNVTACQQRKINAKRRSALRYLDPAQHLIPRNCMCGATWFQKRISLHGNRMNPYKSMHEIGWNDMILHGIQLNHIVPWVRPCERVPGLRKMWKVASQNLG